MEQTVLTSFVLPFALAVIMLGLGLSLRVADFKAVVIYPRAVAVGLFTQIVLLPLAGLGLALAFDLSPLMAVGLMLVAACPGGSTSNLVTFVARGDTALAVLLTALSGLITIVTIPLVLAFSIAYFGVDADTIRAPVAEIMAQLVVITAVPVGSGMLIRHFRPAWAERMDRPSRVGSAAIFVFILAMVILDEWSTIRTHFVSLSGVTVSLNVGTMVLGFLLARLFAVDRRRSVTIAISSGIQNGTLAIVIATSILKVGDVAVPGGVYSLVMFLSGGVVMYVFGVRARTYMQVEAA